MMAPSSTYRLQVTSQFDLLRAAEVAEYVERLGAGWLYLSPILTAADGSEHGYDVVDHRSVDPARGGTDAFERVAWTARRLGLGVLVDIVPNHVGIETPSANPWWHDVLLHGRSSRYAEAFDIDWDAGQGKVRLPVLGDEERPDLRVEDGTIRYGALTLPIAPGTADDPGVKMDELLARQHYELISWRRAATDLNYRRFFAVNTLAAIRVEVPWVFEESHAEIVRWIRQGLATGLRIDHPDGLADPGGYLDMLAEATDHTYVVVEKILQRDEQLPSSWAAAGTTGYEALADIDRVLVDPDGAGSLDELDTELRPTDEPSTWDALVHDRKRDVADLLLQSEVRRIVRDLPVRVRDDVGVERAADAVAELLACFPVYRSYLPLGRHHLERAARDAATARPDLAGAIGDLEEVLADPDQPAARRFQQTSGMVMAKGVEDSAFYRWTRLGSLTEVGGDPGELSIDVAELHRRQQVRQAAVPATLTALTTHDTKRSEDVRARLHVLAEVPAEWRSTLLALRRAAPIKDGSYEELLWQAVVGAWPITRDRLQAYAEKAAREAGRCTTWTEPSDAFEESIRRAVDAVFDDPDVAGLVDRFVDVVRGPGWSNSLSAKLIQLAGPGVPDVYQGTELWDHSLVDPDNRRPVDFDHRRELLDRIDAGELPAIDESGAVKLLVTSRTLRVRRSHPDWFTRYAPVEPFGSARDHVVAFDRGEVVAVATRLPVGLQRRGGWGDTGLVLPRRPMIETFTGRRVEGGEVDVATLLERYPVALLAPDAERGP
ncbi:MAG: malto-oligosyltrehalose synthase [Ilumatobacteraceae bacterium]